MPRTARASVGGMVYHVINRGNARGTVFHKPEDYAAFLKLLGEAGERSAVADGDGAVSDGGEGRGRGVRLLGYCLMPNHFHLVLWPRGDGELSTYMQWLLTSHVRRYHRHYRGSGHVWQGRFKAFPVQEDGHYLAVLAYVERNALRAGLESEPGYWPYGSAYVRRQLGNKGAAGGVGDGERGGPRPEEGPVALGADWLDRLRRTPWEEEVRRIRLSVERGTPFGDPVWQKSTAERLGLESSLRPRGRPRREKVECPL